MNEGKVQVVVKSRQIPSRTIEFAAHRMLPIGNFYNLGLERAVVFESVLDEEHRRAIGEGRRLANNLGLELEVVDRSKLGLFRRLLSSLGGSASGSISVVVPSLPAGPRIDPRQGVAQSC